MVGSTEKKKKLNQGSKLNDDLRKFKASEKYELHFDLSQYNRFFKNTHK